MKANAKKLLALIMAFAMVMSLAAPAMAADASGSGNTATLETQAEKSNVSKIVEAPGGYTISFTTYTDVAAPVTKAWTDADSVYATVTTADYGTKLIGTKKKVKKTVTATAAYTAAGTNPVTAEFVIDDPAGILYKASDDGLGWSELGTTVDWFGTSPMLQVKGSVYQEAQPDGSFKLFYKLTPTTTSGSDTIFDTSASAKPVYAVATKGGVEATYTASEWDSDTEKRDALASAMVIDPDTYTVGTTLSTSIKSLATVSMGSATGAYTYTYANYGEEGATFTLGVDKFTVAWGSGVNTTATVKARVTYDANQFDTSKTATATTLETNVDAVKADLAKKDKADSSWTLASVTKDGDYMTVTVSKPDPSSIPTSDNVATATNVETYSVGTVSKAGLTDLSQDGFWYDGSDSTGKTKNTIAKGTKLYGQVAVKKTDIPDEVKVTGSLGTSTATHFYFATEAAMKAGLENQNCGKDATVKYTKLVVNKKDGDKTNGAYSGGSLLNDWVNATGAFVEKDQSYTLENVVAHNVKLVKKITPSTCGADGTEVDENICKICGNVISSTTKTLPRDQSSLEVYDTNTKNHNYAFKNAAGAWKGAPATTGHYLETEKITTTLKTKESKGTIQHDYYCNYGVLHPEWSWTEETDKTAMEHSGRWDNIVWTTQNTQYARDPRSLYGYGFYVFDTDYELATLPLNDTTKYDYFAITSMGAAVAQPDGTYTAYGFGSDNTTTDDSTFYLGDVNCKVVSTTADGKKGVAAEKYYMASTIVKNIKKADKDCLDGSATIEINIYEVSTAAADITPANVADTIKNKQATLVKTFTKDVVVPAEKTHVDANNDGKCDNCGTAIEQGNTEPTPAGTDISTAVVTFKAMTYTGKVAQPSVTVTLDGVKLAKGVDYEVEEMQDVNAGTYPLIVKGKGDFTGRVVGNVTINKAKQPMKLSASKINAKVKDVKKKAKTYALKVTKAQGKVTVKSNKKNVSWKSNKVTVKKGTKKMTVKLTFKAAGNANYNSGSKTAKVIVK